VKSKKELSFATTDTIKMSMRTFTNQKSANVLSQRKKHPTTLYACH